jgi:antitoxin YefM
MTISITEARKNLFPLVQQVNDDQEAIEISSRKGGAFLVSADEYRSLRETAYLLRSPANAARLLAAKDRVEAGLATSRELIDPDSLPV